MLKLSDSDSEKNIDYLPLSFAVESKTLKRGRRVGTILYRVGMILPIT